MAPVRLSEPDPIEFLVTRRFPSAWSLDMPTSLSREQHPPVADIGVLRQSVETYRLELSALAPEELTARYSEEHAKAVEESRLRREQEERSLVFHQPWANADFSHWSKAAHWTLDEAIALSFGKAPEHVTWKAVASLTVVSAFAGQYARRRDLALRAVQWEQLFDPVLPGIFLAWCERLKLPVPAELTAAVEECGVQVADWKKLYEEGRASWEKTYGELNRLLERSQADAKDSHAKWLDLSERKSQLISTLKERIAALESDSSQPAEPVAEKSLGTRERDSLLKLVIGMAVGGYGYDPAAKRSDQPQVIADDLARQGIPLDVDTVRKWLREAAGLLADTTRHGDRSGR
jgi:hypothetical protein